MSFDMKQHVMMSSQSVLGNYFSKRSHAIKEDLESFKAFLILLKYKYMDRVEIPRTVIKLLHMYHPQDGYEAYMKLLKIICVLLEELDQDILKYLLSIIPPPNLYGSCDVKSMKDEVRGITGFDLLSTPAFHTWVLPVLKNTSNIKQKDLVAENKPTNSTELTQVQPKIDIKTEVLSAKNEDNAQNFENTLNVSSDNESITSEPKFENYDLYEIVGDLSKTILNQLSSKPEYHKLSFPYKQMKNLFDLEAMMAPSVSVDRTGCYENGEKKAVVEDLAVEPVLEKSMKNFIARAYGLLPDVSSGEVRSNKEVKEKVDSNTKKKIDNCTKIKSTKQPKRKKSLLDELTRPQKKSLMSYLITPLDPITDNTETHINLSNIHGSKSDVNDMKKKTKSTLKKNVSSIISSQAAAEVQIEPPVESKENIDPEIVEIETAITNTETVNEKFKNVLPVTTVSEGTDKISIFTSHENMLRVSEKADIQTYDEKLYAQAHDKKVDTRTCDAKLEVTTQHGEDDIQTNNNKDDKIPDERDKDNEDTKEIEVKHVVEIHSALTNQENDSNAGIVDFVGKDVELEWNRENMKLFGINVTDEDICLTEPEIKVADENSDKMKPILPVPPVPNNPASEPLFHGFSLYKSHTSKEHLSYLHDLAVGKYTPQIKDPFPLLVNEDKEPSQIDKEKKPVSETNKNEFKANSVPNSESCLPSKLQSVNPPSKTWLEYTRGVYDPQHSTNMQMQRNPSVSFHSDPTRLRQYLHQATPIHNVSGSTLGNTSIPVSYESAYQTVPISQDWMMKASSTAQNVPYPNLGTYAYYAQNPTYRELAQQRARFAQRTAFLQAPPALNNYMNSAHTLMMNGFWGSYPSVRPGVYARAGEIPPVMSGLPHAVYPMTDAVRQQQRLRAMCQGVLPNYVAPQMSTIQAQLPPKNKRRKLEEIVGRLKETEKTT